MRIGQKIGMAHRKKNVVMKRGMLIVCHKTTSVWRRRLSGTLRGAHRILRTC